jgi:hypothetical protein
MATEEQSGRCPTCWSLVLTTRRCKKSHYGYDGSHESHMPKDDACVPCRDPWHSTAEPSAPPQPSTYECKRCGQFVLSDRHWARPIICEAAAASPVVETAQRKKANHVGAPAIFALEQACRTICEAFDGFGCYLVGSALERPDWRDVDLRYIMADDEFAKLFPSAGQYWEQDARWLLLTVSISERLSKLSGLPVDFQIQPQTHANERHKGPRHSIGLKIKLGAAKPVAQPDLRCSQCGAEFDNKGICKSCGYTLAQQQFETVASPEPAQKEELVIEIARELYDRFVMGGWEPQDAYPSIRAWLGLTTEARDAAQGGEK